MDRYGLLAAACMVFASAAQAALLPTDSDIHQMLVTRIDRQKWGTGIVVGIVTQNGKRVFAYGTTTKGGKQKAAADTVFDIGSITKVFTALALSDMAQRGEVDLDDPVVKYMPSGTTAPHDGDRQITLTDLATHTAGLPLRPGNLQSKDPNDKYAGYLEPMLIQFLATYKPQYPIGTHYDYSNVGYGLLGTALAHRANTSYSQLIRNRITGPLGLSETRIELSKAMSSRVASGYEVDLTPTPPWDRHTILQGDGALRSTANDLMKFLDAILGFRKTPLAPALQAMTRTRRPGGMQPATSIALAWNILDDNGKEIVWKNGSVGGFRSFIGYDAKAKIGVVAWANAQTGQGADDIGLHILDPNIPVDSHIPTVHTEVAFDPALLERYAGTYKFSETDIMTVTHEGDGLFVKLVEQDKLQAFPEANGDFFFKVADAQITFEIGPDGKAQAAIWHQSGQDQRGVRTP